MNVTPGLDDEIGDPPKADPAAVSATRQLAARASTVRAIGLVYLVNAGLGVVNAGVTLAFPGDMRKAFDLAQPKTFGPEVIPVLVAVMSAFGVLMLLALGLGLRSFRGWARWLVVIFSTWGLISLVASLALLPSFATPAEMALAVACTTFPFLFSVVLALPSSSPMFTAAYRSFDARNRASRPGMSGRDKAVLAAYYSVIAVAYMVKGYKIYRGA